MGFVLPLQMHLIPWSLVVVPLALGPCQVAGPQVGPQEELLASTACSS